MPKTHTYGSPKLPCSSAPASGGAAAALAAGLTSMELGSDSGGSLRVPAHFCRVFCHKPTWGLLPACGDALVEMAAGMDIGVALELLAIPDPDDSQLNYTLPPGSTGLAGRRVALWVEDRGTQTDGELVTALYALADAIKKRGALVSRTARPDFNASQAYYIYVRLLAAAYSGFHGDEVVARLHAQATTLAPDAMSTHRTS
jgi:amidase